MRALLVPAALLLVFGAFVGAGSVTACNATGAQIASTVDDGVAVAGCVLSEILSGITDPAQLLTCAGATEKLIVQIIDDFTAQRVTDAGLGLPLQLRPALSPQQIQWLTDARVKAVTALAAKASSK